MGTPSLLLRLCGVCDFGVFLEVKGFIERKKMSRAYKSNKVCTHPLNDLLSSSGENRESKGRNEKSP